NWLAVLLIAWLMPAADLLGARAADEEKRQAAAKSQQITKAVTPLIKNAKKRLQNRPALKEQLAALDDIQAKLAKLADRPEDLAVQTVKDVTSLAEQIRQQQLQSLQRQTEAMRSSLARAAAANASGLVQQLAKSLASGDYQQASRLLQQLQGQVQAAAKDPAKAAQLAGQLQQLADALQKQALSAQLAAQLKAAGVPDEQLQNLKDKIAAGAELSKAELQELKKSMLNSGLSMNQANQLLQKIASACQGAGAACKLGNCLGNAAAGLMQA
ncbi:unnamed protein product, partial [marine sediment metagenome]